MNEWAQIDPVVGAPLNPNKQTRVMNRQQINKQCTYVYVCSECCMQNQNCSYI